MSDRATAPRFLIRPLQATALAISLLGPRPVATAQNLAAGVSADEAQKIAKDAYIFSFPLNYYYRTIYSQIVNSNNEKSLGGFGKWRHDGLARPEDKETTMPNNDTPYSWAWVDVRSEPWVLVQPPADGDRFYSSVWGDLWGHIIGYPGSVNEGQRGGTYLPTPLLYRGYLYLVNNNGILSCYRAETGEMVYQTRIGEVGVSFSASPVAADGRLYFSSEGGDVYVLRAGPSFELLATNAMDEVVMATPAASDGLLVVRTLGHVVGIGLPVTASR